MTTLGGANAQGRSQKKGSPLEHLRDEPCSPLKNRKKEASQRKQSGGKAANKIKRWEQYFLLGKDNQRSHHKRNQTLSHIQEMEGGVPATQGLLTSLKPIRPIWDI